LLLDRQPEHVKHCYHNGARDWWIYTWRKTDCTTCQRVPYQCASWRCETCRRYDASVNFARIRDASRELDPAGFCFLTLTLRRESVVGWETVDAAYRDLSKRSRNFFSRLRRWMKWKGWTPLGKEWVGVVEAHRSGWPHMHFLVWSPELAQHLRENPQPENLLGPELAPRARAVGWGERSTLEPARSASALASYVVKLSGEEATTGELSKLTQLPTTAPLRFRRLRAGKGFLPPRRKNEDYTGTLVRRRPTVYGIIVSPVHKVASCAMVEACCAFEEEESAKVRTLRQPENPSQRVPIGPGVVACYHRESRTENRDPGPDRSFVAQAGASPIRDGCGPPEKRKAKPR
jgi:hypothetical protein